MTLAEITVSAAILSLMTAMLFMVTTTLRHTFAAAQHHAKSQLEQARLVDYVSRDLRRAVYVKQDVYSGSERLLIAIPDYYVRAAGAPARRNALGADNLDQPRNPTLASGTVDYGDPNTRVWISYYKIGSTIYRAYGKASPPTVTPIVSDVQSFDLDYTDRVQTVEISVTFQPKFRFSNANSADARAGTTARLSTLLRNKRLTTLTPPAWIAP
jgi:hypothetical protein